MNKLSFKVLVFFLLIITNSPAPDIKDSYYQVILPPEHVNSIKEFYGIVLVTAKFTCNVNPNDLNSFDFRDRPIFFIEMPNFDVYDIESLHFKDENLKLINDMYGEDFKILNKHAITVEFYGDDMYKNTEKLKRFPRDLEIKNRGFTNQAKFIVSTVSYDKNSFLRLEKDLQECQKLINQKKERKEQPANRLRKFFGTDMK